VAESGRGKVLNPESPSDNPFLHDRQKTFQPRDLWEWLLRLAIILFPLDVGIRRIQLDREEWLKATQNLRRLLFFWRSTVRPTQADESLAALLARREKVRSTQTAPALEPDPELFRPERPATIPLSGFGSAQKPQQESVVAVAPGEGGETTEQVSTTSRLLDAKRRAQNKLK
jgi:hypothetical protein